MEMVEKNTLTICPGSPASPGIPWPPLGPWTKKIIFNFGEREFVNMTCETLLTGGPGGPASPRGPASPWDI